MASAALRIFIAVCAAFCAAPSGAASRALDQGRIHADYHDGEFEKVIRKLEGFLKSGRRCHRSDSVFLAKHLAVVYAANPATRELGRYHMFRLLEMAPGSDLLDMFVGEEVDRVFDKVRKEHALRRAAAAKPISGTAGRPALAPAGRSPPEPPAILPVEVAAHAAEPVAAMSLPVSAPARLLPEPVPSAPIPQPASSAPVRSRGSDSAGAPAWKDRGLWIGGGAALAVVAATLFYAGSVQEPESKTYAVPAAASR